MENGSPENISLLKLAEVYKSRADVHDVLGTVLFTERHPFVAKILRDNDFWTALDAVSGPHWPILAIRPEAGTETVRIQGGGSGYSFLTTIKEWHEPKENLRLLSEFGISNTKKLPMLLVFAEAAPGEILQMQCPFSAKSEEDAYNSLLTIIEKAAMAIEKVTDENIKNTAEVFNLIQAELQQHILLQRIKTTFSLAQWAKSALKIFS